jgi:hypothetical protein
MILAKVAKSLRAASTELRWDCSPRDLFRWIGVSRHVKSWATGFQHSILNSIRAVNNSAAAVEVARNAALISGAGELDSVNPLV